MEKLKILQLCKKFPYPLRDGESIAIYNLSKALTEAGCEISLLAMNTSKHHVDLVSGVANCSHFKEIITVDIDNKIKVMDAFFNLFSSKSYHISRFISDDYKKQLQLLLQTNKFDIVLLETLYLTPYVSIVRKYTDAKIVLRSHNIEHEIWQRIISNTPSGLKKIYLKYLTKKLKYFELSHLNDYDSIITVSERDRNRIILAGFKGNCNVIPIGLDLQVYPWSEISESPVSSVCFIGAMDWIPNREGLSWFLKTIWPLLIAKYPHLELHIAGRNTDQEFKELDNHRCYHHGEIESAISFISNHDLMIVPLLSGSGIRVKILESLALATPVVTTKIGHEGIGTIDGIHLMQADNVNDFINAFDVLISDPEKVKQLKKEGRKFVSESYGIIDIGMKLMDHFVTLIDNPES